MRRKQKDTNNWERSDLYRFFKVFEEPYYGITMEVDCSEAYRLAKDNDYSFFFYSLCLTLKALNMTEAILPTGLHSQDHAGAILYRAGAFDGNHLIRFHRFISRKTGAAILPAATG